MPIKHCNWPLRCRGIDLWFVLVESVDMVEPLGACPGKKIVEGEDLQNGQ